MSDPRAELPATRGEADEASADRVLTQLAASRRSAALLVAAVLLIVGAVWVESVRPLFHQSGVGLFIAIFSCAAGVTIAGYVLVHSVRSVRTSPELPRRFHLAGFVVLGIVTLAGLLDVVALVVSASK